jgi:hypothetical protein
VPDNKLSDNMRVALAALGVALMLAGILAWVRPPHHAAFAPSASKRKGAIGQVSTPSDTFSGLLVGIGAVLVIVAANGLKLASIKIGDAQAAFVSQAQQTADVAQKKAADRGLPDELQWAASRTAFTHAYALASTGRAFDPDAVAAYAVETVTSA